MQTEDLAKAYDDIALMIGGTTMARDGLIDWEEIEANLYKVITEWNDRGMVIAFLGCVFGYMEKLHARLADEMDLTPQELLEQTYKRIYGE